MLRNLCILLFCEFLMYFFVFCNLCILLFFYMELLVLNINKKVILTVMKANTAF